MFKSLMSSENHLKAAIKEGDINEVEYVLKNRKPDLAYTFQVQEWKPSYPFNLEKEDLPRKIESRIKQASYHYFCQHSDAEELSDEQVKIKSSTQATFLFYACMQLMRPFHRWDWAQYEEKNKTYKTIIRLLLKNRADPNQLIQTNLPTSHFQTNIKVNSPLICLLFSPHETYYANEAKKALITSSKERHMLLKNVYIYEHLRIGVNDCIEIFNLLLEYNASIQIPFRHDDFHQGELVGPPILFALHMIEYEWYFDNCIWTKHIQEFPNNKITKYDMNACKGDHNIAFNPLIGLKDENAEKLAFLEKFSQTSDLNSPILYSMLSRMNQEVEMSFGEYLLKHLCSYYSFNIFKRYISHIETSGLNHITHNDENYLNLLLNHMIRLKNADKMINSKNEKEKPLAFVYSRQYKDFYPLFRELLWANVDHEHKGTIGSQTIAVLKDNLSYAQKYNGCLDRSTDVISDALAIYKAFLRHKTFLEKKIIQAHQQYAAELASAPLLTQTTQVAFNKNVTPSAPPISSTIDVFALRESMQPSAPPQTKALDEMVAPSAPPLTIDVDSENQPTKNNVIKDRKVVPLHNEIPPEDIEDIERLIGVGGIANIYQGKYKGKAVALKQIYFSEDTAIESFLSEVSVLNKFKGNPTHKVEYHSIIKYYGWSYGPNGCKFILLELMAGGSLYDYIRTQPPVTWECRLGWALGITNGLKYLHDQDLIHRDLKSPNVLLDETCRTALISDFGLTHAFGETIIANSKLNATLKWMAPEILSYLNSDLSSELFFSAYTDIYSLGVILWEIAAWAEPFANETDPMQIQRNIINEAGMEIPEETPTNYAKLIVNCRSSFMPDRPTTTTIQKALADERRRPFFERKKLMAANSNRLIYGGRTLDHIKSDEKNSKKLPELLKKSRPDNNTKKRFNNQATRVINEAGSNYFQLYLVLGGMIVIGLLFVVAYNFLTTQDESENFIASQRQEL